MLDVKQLFLSGHWSLLTVAHCICVVWLVGSDFAVVVVYNTRHILGAAVIYLYIVLIFLNVQLFNL